MYLTHVDLGVQRRKNGGMDWKAIGRRARRLRQDKGWTQAQLGKRAGGVSANTIRGFEKGTLNTRWPKIKDIVRALGTTIEALAEPDNVVKPADPLLVGLTREDLTVARAYHDSQTTLRQRVMTLLQEGTDQEQEQTPSEARPDLARLATVLTEVTSAADRTELVDSFIDAVKASVLARRPDDVGVAPVVSPRREKRR